MKMILLFAVVLTGCSYFQVKDDFKYSDANYVRDRAEVENAFQLLKQKEYKLSAEAFENFRNMRQTSPLWMKAQLGLADSYHQLGRSDEALKSLRVIRDSSLKRNPAIAALASYQMSFIFEDLGQFDRTLAALSEAENQGRSLDPRIFKVEIPARKSIAFAKLGQTKESQAHMASALRGIDQVRTQQKNLSANWEAQAMLAMGRVSTQSQAGDNWENRIQVLNLVYPILYRVMLMSKEPESSQARQILYDQYQSLFNLIYKLDQELTQTRQKAVELEIFLQRAALYRGESNVSGLTELYKLEDDIRKKLSQLVFSGENDMPLTSDSLQRSIKLEGYRLVDPDVLDRSEIFSGKDPNL